MRHVKKNIINIALKEAAQFLGRLNTSKTFKAITDKYIKKHNKGIFVNFTFNAVDSSILFKGFQHKYSFETDKEVILPFNRNKVVHISNLNKKIDAKTRKLMEIQSNIRKVKARYKKTKEELHLLKDEDIVTLNKPTSLIEEQLLESFHNGDTLTVNDTLLALELHRIKYQLKVQRQLRNMLQITTQNTPYVEKALEEAETAFLKQVLKRYFTSIETQAQLIFGNAKLFVGYDEDEWVKDYHKAKKEFHFDDKVMGNLTPFETRMMRYIEDNCFKYQLLVRKDEFSYSIGNHTRYGYFLPKKASYVELEYKQWEQEYLKFQEQNPEFLSSVRLYEDLSSTVGKDIFSANALIQYIFKNFSQDMINQYNFLNKQLEKAEKAQHEYSYKIKKAPDILEAFPEIQFEVKQKQSMAHWIVSRKKEYEDIITTVCNNEYELRLAEEPSNVPLP